MDLALNAAFVLLFVVVNSLVWKIGESFVDSIVKKVKEILDTLILEQVVYRIDYDSKMNTLKTEVEKLDVTKNEMQHVVNEAKKDGQRIGHGVDCWLETVNRINEEVERFLKDEATVKKWWLGGWCPSLISRYFLSREAKKKTQYVMELQAEKSSIIFSDFGSRILIIDEIMAALKDDNVNVIGICGLGGIGKTTMAEKVCKRVKAEKLFDEIVMTFVTSAPDPKKIQDEIADKLDLMFKAQSLTGRAARLRARLVGLRVLVILDDVWARLDLEEVGIPLRVDHKCCKVILTSRSQDVCEEMRADRNFTIGVLTERESWNLFKERVGNSIESPDLHPIAKKVVKECGGLPLAIVIVGTALKGKSERIWKDALRQLRMSIPKCIPRMLEELYQSIEMSFFFLQSQEAESCLLLCCLFPEGTDILVEDLVRYGMGLSLFEGIDSLIEVRDRVHTLVDQLKSCYLLSDGYKEESVKVHDIVRDVIMFLATKGHEAFMFGEGQELKEWPTKGMDPQYSYVSLISNSNKFHELREGLPCPKPDLLLLECMDDSLKAPDKLFEGMKELKVLQLKNMFIPSPQPSLSVLTKLQTLCLHDCKLENIYVIGELKRLLILSFRNSSIKELPQEIGNLTHLRLLDLTGCESLTAIPPGVISSLKRLEELYLRNSGLQWVVEEEGKGKDEVNLAELLSLSNLITLETCLPVVKFPRGINLFENLVRFGIFINAGEGWQWCRVDEFRNELVLNLYAGIPVDSWINVLLRKTEILTLTLRGVNNIFDDITRQSFIHLKSLTLVWCQGLKYLIDSVDLTPDNIFPNLESLIIDRANNLKMICHGKLPAKSFRDLRRLDLRGLPELMHLWKDPTEVVSLGNLRWVVVKRCDRLENLFSQSIAGGLLQLEVLVVESCQRIEEIVATERGKHGEATNKIRFPKLTELRLVELQSIICFCKKMDEIEFPQLSTLYLKDLPALRSYCPNSLASEGNHDIATHHLFNGKVKSLYELRSIKVYRCNRLLNVFSSNLVRSLKNLEELKVQNCNLLEVVFDFEGINIEEGHSALALTCLRNLLLLSLPKLTHLWKKLPPKIGGFQNLQSLEVDCCWSLKNIFTPSIVKLLVKLEKLCISNCSIVEIVGKNQEDSEENEKATKVIVFPQLNYLHLENLEKLISFGPEPYTFECPVLKDLSLNDANMKVFIPAFLDTQKQGKINARFYGPHQQQITFPSLEVLELVGEDNVGWIVDGHLPAESLHKLRKMLVQGCRKLLTVVPSNLLPRLQELEGLTVRDCASLVEVFEVEGLIVGERDVVLLSKLKHLVLECLPELKHILKRVPKGILFFQSLNFLHVWNCDGLKNLFSTSMAKSAEQLQELDVSRCEMMTEIFVEDKGEGDEKAMDKFEFPQLRCLTLRELPNLVSFFPKMHTTASNFLMTDSLKANDVGSGEVLPKLNLHIHIEHLFNEKVSFPSLEELTLSCMNKLNEIWCNNVHRGTMGFQYLKSVIIWDCGRLRSLFYSSMARGLVHLEELEIVSCEMMEEIVVQGDNEREDRMDKIVIPQLKSLKLSWLPNLMGFCLGHCAFDLPSLVNVSVDHCPKMKALSFGFLSTPESDRSTFSLGS